jgi:hypothetical protein
MLHAFRANKRNIHVLSYTNNSRQQNKVTYLGFSRMYYFPSSSSVHLSVCSTAAVAVSYWFAAPVSTTEKHQELCVVQSPRGFSSSTSFQNFRQYQHQPSDKLMTTKYQHTLNPNSKFLTESQSTELAVNWLPIGCHPNFSFTENLMCSAIDLLI